MIHGELNLNLKLPAAWQYSAELDAELEETLPGLDR
jgi:hypothetical protein